MVESMKSFLKSKSFKRLCILMSVLLLGMMIAAVNGRGETAQTTVVGTVFAPIQSAATAVSRQIDKIFGNATGRKSYEDKIKELQNEIGTLQGNLADYENMKRQNAHYAEVLELKEENPEFKFEECTVISREKADSFYAFTIGKGSLSGIQKGDSVIYGKYLVGIVDELYPDYAVVRTVLDKKFNAAAYEIVSNESGYVSGTLELAKQGLCRIASLKSDTTVTEGSLICTSGVGGVFPADLIIGKVTEVKTNETDISSYAVIQPGVDIRTLSDVFVITSDGEDGGNE